MSSNVAPFQTGLPAKRGNSGKAFVGGVAVGAVGVIFGGALLHTVFSLVMAGLFAAVVIILVAVAVFGVWKVMK